MAKKAENITQDCFIIMPIADAEGYPKGHFSHVYENIIKPSCSSAGFNPVRADDVAETNLIHLDILKKLIETPLAICDLSSRNPNVLFELGIRQAFDMPVVLIQEEGTKKIFDIAPLRYLEYSKEMKYHDVLEIQESLKVSILATAKADSDAANVNSIVKLLALSSGAQIPDLENGKEGLALKYLQAEVQDMRGLLEQSIMNTKSNRRGGGIVAVEYERLSKAIDRLVTESSKMRMSPEARSRKLHGLMRETKELMHHCSEKSDHMLFRRLHRRIHEAETDL